MTYPLVRNVGDPEQEQEYFLDLTYEVTDFIPANITEQGWRNEYNIVLTCAFLDGDIFPLTDAEIAEAEAWLYERVEVS